MELSLNQIALRDLASEKCYCGMAKQKKRSFCAPCYFTLQKPMQIALYKTMDEGYGTAYDEAKDWLRINTERIKT